MLSGAWKNINTCPTSMHTIVGSLMHYNFDVTSVLTASKNHTRKYNTAKSIWSSASFGLPAEMCIIWIQIFADRHSDPIDSHHLCPSTATTAGNAGGHLCPLHQFVPRLRAADADGTSMSLLLHPRNHRRIKRLARLNSEPFGFSFSPLAAYIISSIQCSFVKHLISLCVVNVRDV